MKHFLGLATMLLLPMLLPSAPAADLACVGDTCVSTNSTCGAYANIADCIEEDDCHWAYRWAVKVEVTSGSIDNTWYGYAKCGGSTKASCYTQKGACTSTGGRGTGALDCDGNLYAGSGGSALVSCTDPAYPSDVWFRSLEMTNGMVKKGPLLHGVVSEAGEILLQLEHPLP